MPNRFLSVAALLTATALFSIHASAQTWTFRNGFGQSGAANGLADVGRAVCTDASGNVYVTGKISDDLTGNTVSFGGTALVSAGDDDGFVAKFNSSGVHQWSIRFGGTSFTDIGNAIATDGTSVYVTGEANGTMTVGTSATTYPDAGTGIDGVIMKLDAATGATVWVTRFGGGNTDEGQAICLDPSGNVYVSGIFRTRTANPTATFGAFSRTVQGNTTGYTSDLFVAQLNPTTGSFNWVSTGGIAGGNDNIQGSGICYVPSQSEVVVVGSFRWAATGTTLATYSTTSPASSVTLTNSSATVNEDFCLLEVAASTGAFVSGTGVGSGDGNELGLGVTYDASIGDVIFAGSFSSASVTFPGLPAITNPSSTRDNIMYGRYNPTSNAYTWVKNASNGTSATAADVARAITSDGSGGVYITGNFRNTVTFPGGTSVTASGALSDIFVAKINPANGNAASALQGVGTSATADDIGYGISAAFGGSVWLAGQYASSVTFSPLAALASVGNKEDIFIAKFNVPNGVTSINRAQTSPTNLASVQWTVTFTNAVSGVAAGNFSLVNSGLGGSPAITSVTAVGGAPAASWTVTASTASGTGTLGLNMANASGVSTALANLPFTGQVYTIDLVAPDTSITAQPASLTNSSDASFSFTGTDTSTGVASFQYQLDGGSYTMGTSPVNFSSLSSASHTFNVRAIDGVGNIDASPATVTWTVDTIPPTVNCSMDILVVANGYCPPNVSYTVSVSDNLAISLATTNPISGSVFPLGTNIVTLTARDTAGNTNFCTFKVIVLPGDAPQLNIVNSGTNIVVSWTNSFPCYTLQFASELSSNSWDIHPGPFATNNGTIFATNSAAITNRFYRLSF